MSIWRGEGLTALATGRRTHSHSRREHRVAPRFSDSEIADVRAAADREGLSVGAFVATVALAVARAGMTQIPVTRRQEVAEFVKARVELSRIRAHLDHLAQEVGVDADELLRLFALVDRTVLRIEATADAVAVRVSRR